MHPIIVKFGAVTIYSYGMMVAIAFLVGVYVARIEAARRHIEKDLLYDLVFSLLIGALIGARLYYLVFFDPSSFIKDPVSIFKIWEGGLAIHGAILGGIVAGLIFARLKQKSFWRIADLVAPSLLLGQAIGRIGCFLNGCCFGVPTESIFGVRFPKTSLADIAYRGLLVHPTQIYEFLLNLIGFFILWVARRKVKFDGGIFLLYLTMYSCIRLATSGLRGDSLYVWTTDLKIAQIISIIIFVIAFILFKKRKGHA